MPSNTLDFRISLPPYFVAAIIILFFAIVGYRRLVYAALRDRPPYPPGPTPKSFLFGNASDIPAEKPWERYTEWSKEYGDVIHLRILNQHVIVISSVDAANETFVKRSNIYSDRPKVPMLDLMGWNFSTGFMPYGDTWRQHRRLYQRTLKPEAALALRPIQIKKVNDLLYGLLTSPEDFRDHFRTVAAAVIMSVMYGHDIKPKDDYYVDLAEATVAGLSEPVFTGANPVNIIPALRYIPAWLPGAGLWRFAQHSRNLTRQMLDKPMELVLTNKENDASKSCIVADLLEDCESDQERSNIKAFGATSYAAGADTSVSALASFFYAAAKFPGVLKKAREELDKIVGPDRMPTYEDRASLPHVEAVYREVLRWRPVAPLGLPHSLSDEDVYNGYYMPKGATVLSNVWAMAHNPQVYARPGEFNPSRFFDENGNLNDDDVQFAFGVGRRICPGRHLADATVWLSIACILALFDIGKKKDASGMEIPVDSDFTGGLVLHPLEYECSITPRSDNAKRLVLEAIDNNA